MDEEKFQVISSLLGFAFLNTATKDAIAKAKLLKRENMKLKKIAEEKRNYHQELTDLKEQLKEKRDLLILQRTKGGGDIEGFERSDVAGKTDELGKGHQEEIATLMLRHRQRIQEIEDQFSNHDDE